MAVVSEEMAIDSVDQNDEPIAVIPRSDVFTLHAGFRVAHVLVFNPRGELLVQQLASNRKRHAGAWGSSVAAYLFAGESYRHAAERRLEEELGFRDLPLDYIGKNTMMDQGSRKFVAVFTAISDGPFNFDRNHIERLEFLSLSRIRELQTKGSRIFTPTFMNVLGFYEDRN